MKASVIAETCIGCTLCTQLCPSVFKMNGDKAVAYADPVPREAYECSRKAADDCPVQAIIVTS